MSEVELGDGKSKYFCEREGRWRTYQELKETENDLKAENESLEVELKKLKAENSELYREIEKLETELGSCDDDGDDDDWEQPDNTHDNAWPKR